MTRREAFDAMFHACHSLGGDINKFPLRGAVAFPCRADAVAAKDLLETKFMWLFSFDLDVTAQHDGSWFIFPRLQVS